MLTFIIFILVLSVLIFAHELGHFLVAKRAGIRVEKFAIGFGPSIIGFEKGETFYSLNLIPFGGYVKMYGEETQEKLPGSFASKSVGARASVVSAGVIFNLILAFLFLSLVYMVGAPVAVDEGERGNITILEAQAGSPAEKAGLKTGDQILRLSFGEDVLEVKTVTEVQDFISAHENKEINIEYLRGEEVLKTSATPSPILGIAMDKIAVVSYPIHKAIWEGLKETVLLTVMMVKMFGVLIVDIFKGGDMAAQVSGPVGIFSLVGQAAVFGFIYLLRFTALLSINLAILNMIPIPALDGGHLLFLAIEKIKRSPVSQKVMQTANLIGFALLILLMVLVTYNDIAKIFFK